MDREAVEQMAAVWATIGSATRLATLQGIRAERTLQAIADDIDVSRNAIQMQVRELEERRFLYRDPDADYRYQLTPIGQTVLAVNDAYGSVLVEALARVEAAEEQARAENEHLSGEVFDRAVQQRTWALVWEELEELLSDPE